MNSGHAVVVLDPYDWLPSYGESGVTVRSQGLDWIVEIVYEDASGTGLLKRELVFEGVACFYYGAFPGPSMLNIHLQEGDNLGSLVEYPDSEAALAWKQHFENTRSFKHYVIWFLSENLTIQVVAKDVVLTEPSNVSR